MIRQEYIFFIALVIIVIIFQGSQLLSIHKREMHAGICTGVVTKSGVQRGPYIRYSFFANGNEYSSFTGSGYEVKMHVGDSVKIEYDTTDPNNNVVVYPEF